jgi:hypothetical protein
MWTYHIWAFKRMDMWTYGHLDIWTYGHNRDREKFMSLVQNLSKHGVSDNIFLNLKERNHDLYVYQCIGTTE